MLQASYQHQQAEIARALRVALDAALRDWERGEAAAERQYREDYADAARLDPVMDRPMAQFQAYDDRMTAIAALDQPKYVAEKIAERDEAVALAEALRDWVHDVGEIHVALAQEAKTAADTLAAAPPQAWISNPGTLAFPRFVP